MSLASRVKKARWKLVTAPSRLSSACCSGWQVKVFASADRCSKLWSWGHGRLRGLLSYSLHARL
eukprot:13465780-Alexandrium_andersonii.AAC.1